MAHDILDGASLNLLADIFELDRRTAGKRIRASRIKSCGERNGSKLFSVKDAAPYLMDKYLGKGDVEDKVQQRTADQEEKHWSAMLKRQKYEENEGDLWRTSKVLILVAEVFKRINNELVIFETIIERDEKFHEKQRELIRERVNVLRTDLHRTLTERYDVDDLPDVEDYRKVEAEETDNDDGARLLDLSAFDL